LPPPVSRYFDLVLPQDRQTIRSARYRQAGHFLLRPRWWCPFTAIHSLAIAPAGFLWDATIRALPGVAVHVRDSFSDGVGSVEATVFSAITLMSVHGTRALAVGALQRYLAEAVWCPPALLPTHDVEWDEIDARNARAALTAGGTRVSLDFHFGDDGLVERVYTPARPRLVGRHAMDTPWQGRFHDYAERDGLVIPLAGDVEWLLPGGPQPYWRGRITAATFAQEDGS
jgi:hypothetical protein